MAAFLKNPLFDNIFAQGLLTIPGVVEYSVDFNSQLSGGPLVFIDNHVNLEAGLWVASILLILERELPEAVQDILFELRDGRHLVGLVPDLPQAIQELFLLRVGGMADILGSQQILIDLIVVLNRDFNVLFAVFK